MRNFKIEITKIILFVLVINIFFVINNLYFPNNILAFEAEKLQKFFLWPLNQLPQQSKKITDISLENIEEPKSLYEAKIDCRFLL